LGTRASNMASNYVGRSPAKRKSKSAHRQRRGRLVARANDGAALNQDKRHNCKRSFGNLCCLAAQQGQLEWFRSAKRDEGKLMELLAAYHRVDPPPAKGEQRKRATPRGSCSI